MAAGRGLGSGPAVLRNHVRSLKHHWDEACFVPDAADPAGVERVGRRFVALRDGGASGGFVLRRFETFVSAEVRTWWVRGRLVLSTAHPDTPDAVPHAGGPDAVSSTAMESVAAAVAGLGLPFVTVDLVRRDDGAWRVVELGDEQVSDLPTSTPADALVTALRRAGDGPKKLLRGPAPPRISTPVDRGPRASDTPRGAASTPRSTSKKPTSSPLDQQAPTRLLRAAGSPAPPSRPRRGGRRGGR